MCDISFHGIMTGKYNYDIIVVIDGHLKVKIMTVYFLTNTNNTSFWWDFDWIIRLCIILAMQCQVQGQKSLNRKGKILFFHKGK